MSSARQSRATLDAIGSLYSRGRCSSATSAPLFLDLLWPIFLVTGLESVRIDPGNTVVTPLDLHDYPWSHSLAMAAVWSVLCAGLFWAGTHYGRGALVVALGVFSHWAFDFVTHRPDMPLYPGSARSVGLGLWNSLPATLAVEVTLFVVGVAIYARATRAIRARGIVAFWLLVVVVSIAYVGAIFGPPPPSVEVIKYVGLTSWLFVVWAWWIDRNRMMRASAPAPSI
jgi:membrane-bound metal-dependent hydrolase YbcI (DUF457 family)